MTPSRDTQMWLRAAQERVGHTFEDPDLLAEALTHPSYAAAHPGTTHYERLEFLGDAILGLVVVQEIFDRFPSLAEGEMTKLKIAVVSGPVLTSAAEDLGLEDLLRLGESELSDGGRGRPSALENALEALVGAVYLDAGIQSARAFVLRVLGDLIHPTAADEFEHPKSRLQELLQARGSTPEYEIVAFEGPPHKRTFTARVLLGDEVLGEGTGPSKRAAEMEAARQALERISENTSE